MKRSMALATLVLGLWACGGDGTDSGGSAAQIFTATIDGASFSATDFSTHGYYTGTSVTKVAFGITGGEASRSIRIWFGVDANGDVVPGTYTLATAYTSTAPGVGAIEYSANASTVSQVGSGGTPASAGTLQLDEVYEDASWGVRGGKGTFTATVGTTQIANGVFDVKVANGK